MKAKSATVKLSPRTHAPEYVLGVDGGGTKTHAVIADEHGRVLGEGFAGPSNPLRVGVNTAAAAVREAVDQACDAAGVRRADIVAAEVGLAGVRRAASRPSYVKPPVPMSIVLSGRTSRWLFTRGAGRTNA